MKRHSISLFLGLLAVGVLVSGCEVSAPDDIQKAGLGNNTVTKYVAVGNSLAAGYQSNGLFESGQVYSYPNLISQQLTKAGASLGTFQQPIYGDPGNADPLTGKAARYELISLVGPVIGPKGLTAGTPTNTTLTRPYDNMGIPGAVLYDFLDTATVASKAAAPRSNAFFSLVQRGTTWGKRIYDQVKYLNPNIITFWLGNNDVLGYATSGGASPTSPTSSVVFQSLYKQALDTLKAGLPNAKVVVATIPDVRSIPFFTTIGPKVAAALGGAKLYFQKSTYAVDSTTFTSAVNPLITLVGSSYVTYLGKGGGVGGGKFYRDKGINPVLVGADTNYPFGVTSKNPWPNALTLDADEQTVAGNAVTDFNNTIKTEAAAHGYAVVDMYAFFNTVKASGIVIAGATLKSDYVTGGLFSLDGVHPSSQGAGVLANKFIEALNQSYGMNILPVDITRLPQMAAPMSKLSQSGSPVAPIIEMKNFESLKMLFP